MPSIDTDTRLIMTVLFVGAVSGVNVYFFSQYGATFVGAYGPYPVAMIFGVLTVGGIVILKALFDLFVNDYIEDFLLQRQINGYWNRKARDEENRKRVRESFIGFQQQFGTTGQMVYGDNTMPIMQNVAPQQEVQTVSPTFLTGFNE
jgi:hypothetical protein|tara:strand:- start:3197 stop:3637 length:441 start_codon:yes stop_codon:yes gene_type:complete